MNKNLDKNEFPIRSDVVELSKGIIEVMNICENYEYCEKETSAETVHRYFSGFLS